MNILEWFSNDEYKQKEISKFVVEGAILQFISSFIMIGLYLFTNIEPFFLLLAPFALFLFYLLIRYVLSGIEFADVFTEADVKVAKKRNLFRALGLGMGMLVLFSLLGRSLFDSAMVAMISGILLFVTDTVSLRKSYRKNTEL